MRQLIVSVRQFIRPRAPAYSTVHSPVRQLILLACASLYLPLCMDVHDVTGCVLVTTSV